MLEILERVGVRQKDAAVERSNKVTALQARLLQNSLVDLRSVQVGLRDDVIELSGRVSSYYAKQIAQILIRHECRSSRIDNAIEVA